MLIVAFGSGSRWYWTGRLTTRPKMLGLSRIRGGTDRARMAARHGPGARSCGRERSITRCSGRADGGSGQPGDDHGPAQMAQRMAGRTAAPVLSGNARGGTRWTPGTVRRSTGSGSARNAPPTYSTATRPATGAGTGTGRADPARPSFRPAGMTRRFSIPCWTWRAGPTGRRCARSGTAGGSARGTREDVEIAVVMACDGRIWTAWPLTGGAGVVKQSRRRPDDRKRDRTTRIEACPAGSPAEYRRALWSLSSA